MVGRFQCEDGITILRGTLRLRRLEAAALVVWFAVFGLIAACLLFAAIIGASRWEVIFYPAAFLAITAIGTWRPKRVLEYIEARLREVLKDSA
jgi:hypothetical protein